MIYFCIFTFPWRAIRIYECALSYCEFRVLNRVKVTYIDYIAYFADFIRLTHHQSTGFVDKYAHSGIMLVKIHINQDERFYAFMLLFEFEEIIPLLLPRIFYALHICEAQN